MSEETSVTEVEVKTQAYTLVCVGCKATYPLATTIPGQFEIEWRCVCGLDPQTTKLKSLTKPA